MNKVEQAVAFALEAHEGVCRDSTAIPYILHPLEAAAIASGLTQDEDVIAAAVLHDVLEDTPHTGDEIRERFGDRVLRLVCADTENKRPDRPSEETWKIRKQETLDRLAAVDDDEMIVIFSDKLANLRAIWNDYLTIWEELWKRFSAPDPREQLWYYSGIYFACTKLEWSPLYWEYGRKLREIRDHVDEYETYRHHDTNRLALISTPSDNNWVFRWGATEDLMVMTDNEFQAFLDAQMGTEGGAEQ